MTAADIHPEDRDRPRRRSGHQDASDHGAHAEGTRAGRRQPLVDWGLDALAGAGVEKIVVNMHHHADQMTAYLAGRSRAAHRHIG